MNDHDEAHLLDVGQVIGEDPYELELWVQKKDFNFDQLRNDFVAIYDEFWRTHMHMIRKTKDDLDRRELRYQLLSVLGLND